MKKLNANQIKYLLAALMVLDHLPCLGGYLPCGDALCGRGLCLFGGRGLPP